MNELNSCGASQRFLRLARQFSLDPDTDLYDVEYEQVDRHYRSDGHANVVSEPLQELRRTWRTRVSDLDGGILINTDGDLVNGEEWDRSEEVVGIFGKRTIHRYAVRGITQPPRGSTSQVFEDTDGYLMKTCLINARMSYLELPAAQLTRSSGPDLVGAPAQLRPIPVTRFGHDEARVAAAAAAVAG